MRPRWQVSHPCEGVRSAKRDALDRRAGHQGGEGMPPFMPCCWSVELVIGAVEVFDDRRRVCSRQRRGRALHLDEPRPREERRSSKP
jgi:hypothetical protein